MCEAGLSRLVLICEKLNAILKICEVGVEAALCDAVMRRPAILMHIVAICEQAQKLAKNGELTEVLDGADIRGLTGLRNQIAHGYEGVDIYIVADVVESFLPRILAQIEVFLQKAHRV